MERKRWSTVLGALVIGTVFLFFLFGCGGGSGGSGSSGSVSTDLVPPGPVPSGTVYSGSEGDIAIFAKVSGSTITSYVSNFAFAFDDVYTGTSTIQADRSFSIDYHPYPAGGPTVFSATGVVDASGNVIHWTATNFIFVLNETLELPANSYPGLYYGNNTINGGSGVIVGTIDWWGNLSIYYGNHADGYTRITAQLYTTNSFSTGGGGNITLNGSVSATGITGTWHNSVTNISGTFSAPNISSGGGGGVTPPSSYTLTVNAANGTVAKNPDQTSYASGTSVQLTAAPNPGYIFTGWSGDITGTTNPATVTMNSNKTITANFSSVSPTSSGQYEVWGGNIQLSSTDNFNPENHAYVNLGSSNITNTFLGKYNYYVVVTRNNSIAFIDAVGGSNGKYLTSTYSGNTDKMTNVSGPPDGLFASVGALGTTGRGYLGLSAVAEPLTSITVYTP